MELHRVVLLLGGNLGDRSAILASSRALITTLIGSVGLASREYATSAHGTFVVRDNGGEELPFLNQALVVDTYLAPESVLDVIGDIERKLGRLEHDIAYTPAGERLYQDRTIDIDILFYDDEIINTERLIVPHPRLRERLFAVEPVAEIIPEYSHPTLNVSMKELFNLLLLGDSQ